jgi:hypothetical protein
MDVFLFAVVLVAALVAGGGDKPAEHPADTSVQTAGPPSPENKQAVRRDLAVPVCDSTRARIRQRDLSGAVKQEVNRNDR